MRGQASIKSRDEHILDSAYRFLNSYLSLPAVSPLAAQQNGRQILIELFSRIKGVHTEPQKCLRDIYIVTQKIFMQDADGMSNVTMDILRQVLYVATPALLFDEYCTVCATLDRCDPVNSGLLIPLQPCKSAQVSFSRSNSIAPRDGSTRKGLLLRLVRPLCVLLSS